MLFRFAASLIVLSLSACGKPSTAPRARPVSVLFVGDSLLLVNDLPRVFAAIAASRGDRVDVVVNATGGGHSTSRHALADDAFRQKKLPSKDWDFAVLQEHSALPIIDVPGEEIAPHVRALSQLIRENAARTRLVFLETWGFKDGNTENCAYAPVLCTYGSMQDALLQAYSDMARENNGLIAPAGEAWREVRHARPDVELYGDDHHPSLQGTYLSACVLYAILFKKKSHGADPQGLEPARAEALQDAADAVVFGPKASWDRFEQASR